MTPRTPPEDLEDEQPSGPTGAVFQALMPHSHTRTGFRIKSCSESGGNSTGVLCYVKQEVKPRAKLLLEYYYENTQCLNSLSCEFILRISSVTSWLVPKHMASLVTRLRVRTPVLACRNEQDIAVFSTPGRARHVVRREHNVLQMLAFRTEDHYAI